MIHKIIIFSCIFSCLINSFIYGKKLHTFDNLQKPSAIVIDNTKIYIADGHQIFIHSLLDGYLLKRFGKSGEGPGEFKSSISNLTIQDNQLLICNGNKLSFFSKNGSFIKEIILRNQILKSIYKKNTEKYPILLTTDSDYIYTAFKSEIQIISLRDGLIKKRFGKLGEGPGEIHPAIFDITIQDNVLKVTSRNKIIYFTKEGSFLREIKFRLPSLHIDINKYRYNPSLFKLYKNKVFGLLEDKKNGKWDLFVAR